MFASKKRSNLIRSRYVFSVISRLCLILTNVDNDRNIDERSKVIFFILHDLFNVF